MKNIALFLFIFLSTQLYAEKPEPIRNFNDLMQVLNSGSKVRIIIYYSKCQLINNNEIIDKSPEAIGGMDIDTYEYFAAGAIKNTKAFVTLSSSKLIKNPKGNGFVYNYVKVKIFDDNKVQIIAEYLEPKSYEIVMDESLYSTINDGKSDSGGVFLFKNE